MTFALEVRGLAQSYRVGWGFARRKVLDGIDLALLSGRTLGLLGPNGSGKSTLLRLLAGIERPTSGEVRILGRSTEDERARAKLGYLSEGNPFPGELHALETLEFLASVFGMRRKEATERALRALERVGLAGEAKKPLARFSQGMHRRFGLAQAFFHEPELVLLDEPTAGLDAAGQGLLDAFVTEARTRGTSLVISSHYPSDVLRLADEIAVLLEGRLMFRGTPEELVALERRVRIDVEGLAREDLDRLDDDIARLGGRVLRRGPSDDAFLALYRRLSAREPGGPR